MPGEAWRDCAAVNSRVKSDSVLGAREVRVEPVLKPWYTFWERVRVRRRGERRIWGREICILGVGCEI